MTRASNEDTVASLWKTIEKHNIKTVITLHNEIDRAETVISLYKIIFSIDSLHCSIEIIVKSVRLILCFVTEMPFVMVHLMF